MRGTVWLTLFSSLIKVLVSECLRDRDRNGWNIVNQGMWEERRKWGSQSESVTVREVDRERSWGNKVSQWMWGRQKETKLRQIEWVSKCERGIKRKKWEKHNGSLNVRKGDRDRSEGNRVSHWMWGRETETEVGETEWVCDCGRGGKRQKWGKQSESLNVRKGDRDRSGGNRVRKWLWEKERERQKWGK